MVQTDASTLREFGAEMRSSLNARGAGSRLIPLAHHHVDVWNIRLDACSAAAASILSSQERERARLIASDISRRRFVAAKIAVRRILSGYCGVSPACVPLADRRFGKPFVRAPFSRLKFNLSHAGGRALLAVCTDAEVGIDIEKRRQVAAESIAGSWLHDGERDDLVRLSGGRRLAAFFRLWCRKEAVSKAHGSGLRIGFHRFRVSASQACAAVLSWPEGAPPWRLYDLRSDGPFVAALALDRPVNRIHYRDFA